MKLYPKCHGSGVRDRYWNATGRMVGYAEVQAAANVMKCATR